MPSDKTSKFRKSICDFAKSTSAHGYVWIASSSHLLPKTAWMLVLLGAYTGCCVQIASLSKTYHGKPTKVTIAKKMVDKPIFPAVTFCNKNMVKRKYLHELHEAVLKTINSTDISKEEVNKVFSIVGNNLTMTEKDFGTLEENTDTFLDFMSTLKYSRKVNLTQYGHQFNDTLTRCIWNLADCKDNDALKGKWVSFFHWRYGNCYRFNSERMKPLRAEIQGPNFQLQMQFNLERKDYIRLSPFTASMVILIQDQDLPADMYTYGFKLAPNAYHSISIKKKHTRRIDPHQNYSCRDTKKNDAPGNFDYSIIRCGEQIFADKVKEKCNCTAAAMFAEFHPGTELCIFSLKGQDCLMTIYSNMDNVLNYISRSCPPPCDETTYVQKVHSSPFLETTNNVRNNYLEVDIHYNDFEVETVSEELFYKIENLISDIGGQLGLFSGFSVMTLFEIIILIGSIMKALKYVRGKEEKTVTEVHVQQIETSLGQND